MNNKENGFIALGLALALMLLICMPISMLWCWAIGFTIHYGTIFVSTTTTLFVMIYLNQHAHEASPAPLDNLPKVTKEDEDEMREEDEKNRMEPPDDNR